MKYKKNILFFLTIPMVGLWCSQRCHSQQLSIASTANELVAYIENKGQWKENFYFRGESDCATIYLQQGVVQFVAYDKKDLYEAHAQSLNPGVTSASMVSGHTWRQIFIGASDVVPEALDTLPGYYNYIVGDKSRHRNFVTASRRIIYRDLWPGIDLIIQSRRGHFQYQFEIRPGGDPNVIKWRYEGLEKQQISSEGIVLKSSIGDFVETDVEAFQVNENAVRYLGAELEESNGIFSFVLNEYDHRELLIIDPTLVAATYVGSQSSGEGQMLWGYQASYNAAGEVYLITMPYIGVLPSTVGAFDETFNEGVDIGLTKFNNEGSEMMWSTYLGGSESDFPANIIVTPSGEVLVLFQSFFGEENVFVPGNAFDASPGGFMDLVLYKLSEDGSQLVAGTLLGGGLGEGGHQDLPDPYDWSVSGHGLAIDVNGNVLVGASAVDVGLDYQPRYQFGAEDCGLMDAMIFKLGPQLDSLLWCAQICSERMDESFLGSESIFDLATMPDNSIVVSGSTNGLSMPFPESAWQPEAGGEVDGWLARLSADGQNLLAGTYFANDSADRVMMVDIAPDSTIWCVAMTNGTLPQSEGVYSNSSESTYIVRFNDELTELLLSTHVGSNAFEDGIFYPKAFMVDDCSQIYLTGHGYFAYLEGCDVSNDAVYDMGGFYCAVYEPEMIDLSYGTLFGGDHVDGTYSRFDKKGVVYQAVCSCQDLSESLFTPMAGAYDENQSPSCEAAVFKIDFESSSVVSAFMFAPVTTCLPYTVEFENYSDDAQCSWNFGDGEWLQDNSPTISHTFYESGDYLVQLACYDQESCNLHDTMSVVVHVPEVESELITEWELQFSDLCQDTVSLIASFTGNGADAINWNLDSFEASGTLFTPSIQLPGTHNLYMTAVDSACNYSSTLTFEFNTGLETTLESVEFDEPICTSQPVEFVAVTEADSTWWVFGDGWSGFGTPDVVHEYHTPGIFDVQVISFADTGCQLTDTLIFSIEVYDSPEVTFSIDDTLCIQSVVYQLEGGQPPGGNYSGDGVTGDQFNLESAGIGLHTLDYAYTDANGCSGTASVQALIELCDNLSDMAYKKPFIYHDGNLEFLEISGEIKNCKVYDLTGQMVSASNYTFNNQIRISTEAWSSGVYFVVIVLKNGTLFSGKILISESDK